MITGLIAVMIFLAVFGTVAVGYQTRKPEALSEKESLVVPSIEAPEPKRISSPGKKLMELISKVPAEHLPSTDLESIIEALDIKYDYPSVYHYATDVHNGYGRAYFDWHCRCWVFREGMIPKGKIRYCKLYPEYTQLYLEVNGVLEEVEAQRRALEIAGIQHNLDRVAEITEHFRNEREIVKTTTKEILGDSS